MGKAHRALVVSCLVNSTIYLRRLNRPCCVASLAGRAGPRDSYGYHCGSRLAWQAHASEYKCIKQTLGLLALTRTN